MGWDIRPGNEHKFIKRCLYLLFLGTWTITLWIFTIYKIRNDGAATFFGYFTNWNWFLQTLFFSAEFSVTLANIHWMRVLNLSLFLPLVNGTTWLVFWLVFLMLHDNANFLIQLSTIGGGEYELWMVLNGHAMYHVLISISMLVFVIIRIDYVKDAPSLFVNWAKNATRKHVKVFSGWKWYSYVYLVYVYATPLLILTLYSQVFNMRDTYGITSPFWVLVVMALIIVLIFNLLFVFVNMLKVIEPRTQLYRMFKWSHLTDVSCV